jgi:DNA-nicking Smr family endonuclease
MTRDALDPADDVELDAKDTFSVEARLELVEDLERRGDERARELDQREAIESEGWRVLRDRAAALVAAVDRRDHLAELRDQRARERDSAAELRDQDPSLTENDRISAARHDRERAAVDRLRSGEDRDDAAGDRAELLGYCDPEETIPGS